MKYLSLLLLICLFYSCSDNAGINDFCEAVILEDFAYLDDYLDDILEDLEPFPTPEDFIGHEENIFFLIDELERRNDCLDAYLVCYACIKTFPPQSELRIDVFENGFVTSKIFDITTPEFSELFLSGIHNP